MLKNPFHTQIFSTSRLITLLLIFAYTNIPLTSTSTVNLHCDTRSYSSACDASLNLEIIAKFSEIHLKHDEVTNITELIIRNALVLYLPSNIPEFFPNLTRLDVVNSSLKEIHKEDFRNFTKLTALDLSDNDITILEENLFEFIPIMIYIRLQGNSLVTIHPNVFDSLRNLQHLQLHDNPCIKDDVRSVKLMILEVKKNCTAIPIPTSSMSSLVSTSGINQKALAVLAFVFGGMIIAIATGIIIKRRLSRFEYDVSQEEKKRPQSGTSGGCENERQRGSVNLGMVL